MKRGFISWNSFKASKCQVTHTSLYDRRGKFICVSNTKRSACCTNQHTPRGCYFSLYMLVRHTSAHLRTGGSRCCEPESSVSQLAPNLRCHFPPISRYRSQLSPTTFNPPPWWCGSKHSTQTKAREEDWFSYN